MHDVQATRAGHDGRRHLVRLALSCDLVLLGMALLFGTEDQVEGMSAFLEKREAKSLFGNYPEAALALGQNWVFE